MRFHYTNRVILPILTIMFIATACCAPCRKSSVQVGELETATWRLIELNLNPIEKEYITLQFDAEEKLFSGTAPCNNFFGSYRLFDVKGEKRNIEFSSIGSTRKMCPDVNMAIEEEFARELAGVKRVKIEGESLILIDTLEKMIAVLEVDKPE